MLLESIELQGYKTFAGRTRFEFAGPITCIVGPNGSGKSNIADAIRWVLGEQSYRLLRGKKTEDMIFSGSEVRSQSGMALANITFDNSNSWLPIDFSEVSIARRAYRDGTNEYLLNGQRVRLKDISELLSSSGLSERTYTIIGQGLVDAALALRAEDRRGLFEEAAGIGLYRTRREEAQRRLETTHHNIERVEDILSELRPRLRSLERQAERAAQFEQVSSDLKSLLREYYGYHWYKVQEDLGRVKEAALQQEAAYQAAQQKQALMEAELEALREKIHGLRSQLGSWHRESGEHHLQWEEITRHLAVSEERARSLTAQLQQTQDEVTRTENLFARLSLQQEQTEETVLQSEKDLKEASSQLENRQQNLKSLLAQRSVLDTKTREIQQSIARTKEQKRILEIRKTDRVLDKERQQLTLNETEVAISRITDEVDRVESNFKKIQEEQKETLDLLEAIKNDLQNQVELRIDNEKAFQDAQETRLKIHTALLSMRAEMEVLEKAEKDLAGFGEGTRALLSDGKQGKISGILGALVGQLEVPKEFEPAISAALGEYLDSVLIAETNTDRKQPGSLMAALERLLEIDSSGALLPIADLKSSVKKDLPSTKDVIGIAAELVEAAPKIRPAVDTLLGQTVIVKDRQVAREFIKTNLSFDRAVTLSGEVFHANGIVTVGKRSGSGTLSRPRKRRELSRKISAQEEKMRSIENRLSVLDSAMSDSHQREKELQKSLEKLQKKEFDANESARMSDVELKQLQRELEWQRKQKEKLVSDLTNLDNEEKVLSADLVTLQEDLEKLEEQLRQALAESKLVSTDEERTQVNYWNTQVALIQASLENARSVLEERRSAVHQADNTRKTLAVRVEDLTKAIEDLAVERTNWKTQEAEISGKMDALKRLIDPAETELNQAEESQNALEKNETQARQMLNATYRNHSQAQLNLTRTQEKLVRLQDQIEDDLGLVSLEYDEAVSGPTPLPLEGLVESLPKMRLLPDDMEKSIRRQRAQVRRMGAINPEAQTEFKEVKERFSFLTEQIEDLREAERDVRVVISELEEIMKQEFQATFTRVANEFKIIFTRLFGGGNAQLVLTDPNDLTETGIDIEARLPGRRSQGLSLLSGGERSLTATALIFSLLKVSPTPFCVLDEVDAMLDEANVSRFRELLKELAQETQFIVITHNRNTVQVADVIYGVTMGRDSVSQSISLKLDEVAEVV